MLNSTVPIFKMNIESLKDNILLKNNITITEYIAVRQMDINFKVDYNTYNGHIIGSGITCRDAILDYIDSINNTLTTDLKSRIKLNNKSNRILRSMHKLSERGIFYIRDIITADGKNILNWNQYNLLNGRQ